MKKSSASGSKLAFSVLLAVCAGFFSMSAEVPDFGVRRHDLRLSFGCATDRDEGQATYLYELVRR